MSRLRNFVVIPLALLVAGAIGCAKGGSGSACGADGQTCCSPSVCNAGLSCQAGTCAAGSSACGARTQACCATGLACIGMLVCDTGTCAYPRQESVTQTVCPAGATLAILGATLTIPSGALTSCTSVVFSTSPDPAPSGYTTYSPVIQVSPAGLQLAKPATLSIDVTGAPAAATTYWSQSGTSYFEPEPGTIADGIATVQIPRFGQGFVAGRDYVLICADGGTLTTTGATLTIPSGALASCTMVKLTRTAETAPGYTLYSPVFQVEPAAAVLATPASITLDFTGDLDLATLFWSRQGTTGFERASFTSSSEGMTGLLPRFGKGFVADGVNFVDSPDRSCVVSKLVEGRTMAPSTVALFFTVDDCWGRPLTGLTGSDFAVLENGAAISPAESSATILPRTGVEVFTSLVIDMSASTLPQLPAVIASAKEFVTNLQVTKHLPVQIDIQLFAGDQALTQWQAPTLDTNALLSRLDALAAYTPTDTSSTNLNGAVVTALSRVAAAESAFRQRNYGGAFTIGYLVIFTDGRDTAARVSLSDAVKAVKASPDQVVAVGLDSVEYDATSLNALAGNGVITAPDVARLSTAFATVANRMAGQIDRFYLLGYCSPKRAGTTNAVSVGVVNSTNQVSASYTFSAVGFAPGCTAATFSSGCDGMQCGGLGCGACDDRLASCNQTTSLCVNDCLAQGLCTGGSIVNSQGYTQSCAATATDASCGASCVDTTTDVSNCGGCGIACAGGQRCSASACVP